MAATHPTTATVNVVVVKGCASLGIHKGAKAALTLTAIPGFGVRADGLGALVWCSGSRKHIPVLASGATLNLNSGDPTRKVVVEVR